jgi:hypothetical protein
MGQSQLLLIVLGMIIIGIAIALSNDIFKANENAANRDNIITDLNTLGTMAVAYYKKPEMMGGGGKSFTGWLIPTELDSTVTGTYVTNSLDQVVNITATGNVIGDDGVNPISAKATVTSKEIIVNILN